jgi:hypothetical protein
MESSHEEINFLDTTIYKKNNKLRSSVYIKPTDAHQYLRYDSCHPRSTIKSIPYSQMLRMKKIHSDKQEGELAIQKMKGHFQQRRYPNPLLHRSMEKALEYDPKPKDNNSKHPEKNHICNPIPP